MIQLKLKADSMVEYRLWLLLYVPKAIQKLLLRLRRQPPRRHGGHESIGLELPRLRQEPL